MNLLLAQSVEPPPAWHEVFVPHSAHHLLVFVTSFAMIWAAARYGARRRGTPAEHNFRLFICGMIFAWQGASVAYYLTLDPFELRAALPLQLCDIVAWIGAVALLTGWRWARVLLYFWGLGLSSQAFFTPTLRDGPSNMDYWLFWFNHVQVVGAAVYDIVVRGYRPTLRDALVAFAASAVYAAAVVPLNIAFGVNYGFLGNTTPENPTLIDHLGAWPWRIGWIALIVLAWFLTLWGVWRIARWVRSSPR